MIKKHSMRPKLALIIPCYNEEKVINKTAQSLYTILINLIKDKTIHQNSYLFFIDDGSQDKTWVLLNQLHKKNSKHKALKLARNYGHQNALIAGLMSNYKKVDCIISIDADLQQDEKKIPEFITKYKQGAEIVFGIRKDRGGDTFFKRVTALGFYKFMTIMGVYIIKNHADYRLLSQRAVSALCQYPETNLFLRGIISNMGFPSDVVYFNVKKRAAGQTKYNFYRMFGFALEGIVSFSIAPLRMVAFIGLIIFILSLGMEIFALVKAFLFKTSVPGWASTVMPLYFLGGIQILSIGIIGEYIGKIYQETKSRPRYLKEEEML